MSASLSEKNVHAFPWSPWSISLAVAAGIVAGFFVWLAWGGGMGGAIRYSANENLVLTEIRSNAPDPDIEIIEIEERMGKSGNPIVRVKYRGETPFGGKAVRTEYRYIENGKAERYYKDWIASGNWDAAE